MDGLTRRGGPRQARSPHLQLIDTSSTDGTPGGLPTQRRTQSDYEAFCKVQNIVRLVQAGYVSPLAAWPWLTLELGA